MACEILIHRNVGNYSHPDSEKDKRGVYKKGYIVAGKTIPCNWGNKEKFEGGKFVTIRVTNADWEELHSYMKAWELEVDHEHVASNLSVDGHRYKLFSTNPGASLKGVITREKAQKYLDKWNVTIHSVAQNEIVMDCVIFDMLKSKFYWDLDDLSGLSATEISYNESTGDHVVEVNWENFRTDIIDRDKVRNAIRNRVLSRGGIITSYIAPNEYGRFTINRIDVLQWFKTIIYRAIRRQNLIYRRQYYITESQVDQLVQYSENNNGEPYELTKAQLANNVQSFLDRVDV